MTVSGWLSTGSWSGAHTPRPKIETTSTNAVNISADHPEAECCYVLLADTFGTGDYEMATGLLSQLADASRLEKVLTKKELDFMLSVVRGINPRDETESTLRHTTWRAGRPSLPASRS
jgi:hypothetical protein